MSRIRGLELLYSLTKERLRSKEDCLVAALHCLLINENLQCVGTGEQFSDSDASTELLPQDWNQNQEVYTLRYATKDRKNKFLVKVVKAGNILHVNVVLNENDTAAMSANVSKHVSEDYQSDYTSAYLDLDSLSATFRRDILDRLRPPPKGEASRSTDSRQPPPTVDPLAVPRPFRPPVDFDDGFGERQPFPNIGGRDLDPLGQGMGGGMLMDPFRGGSRPNIPPFLPRGSVPPGARFDPFGPNVPGPNRGRPNPDHFRRPDDFDDFM